MRTASGLFARPESDCQRLGRMSRKSEKALLDRGWREGREEGGGAM